MQGGGENRGRPGQIGFGEALDGRVHDPTLNFAVEAAIFGGLYALAGALLITVGYLLERGFYAINDWPRDFSNDHLFSSHTEAPLIFGEYLLRFLVWATAGAFAGAAIYRYGGSGYLALLPASLLVGLMGVFLDDYWGPAAFIFERLPAADSPSLPIAAVIAAICVLAAFVMTWRIMRDMPLHTK